MQLPRCPICETPVDHTKVKSFPFCSARCRQIDLGRWLGERYAVSQGDPTDEEGEGDERSQAGDDED